MGREGRAGCLPLDQSLLEPCPRRVCSFVYHLFRGTHCVPRPVQRRRAAPCGSRGRARGELRLRSALGPASPEGAVLLTAVRTGAGAGGPVGGCGRSLLRLCPPVSSERVPRWTLRPLERSGKSVTFGPPRPTNPAALCGLVRVGHVAAEAALLTCGSRHPPRAAVAAAPCASRPTLLPPPRSQLSRHRDPPGDPGHGPLPCACARRPLLCPPRPGGSVSPPQSGPRPGPCSAPQLSGQGWRPALCPHGRPSVLLTTPATLCFSSSVYVAGSS